MGGGDVFQLHKQFFTNFFNIGFFILPFLDQIQIIVIGERAIEIFFFQVYPFGDQPPYSLQFKLKFFGQVLQRYAFKAFAVGQNIAF